ncbi:MAG: signal transduction histidine kinase regulating citrate/malate metabolism, partial [Pelosinus sp.]|nr:signal transduction histidine kinase regulating citrate/malate metabolism [Pelosinus sp.]
MEDHEVCEEIVTLLRKQRHDFVNHLQVIHAMLQMGRREKALLYIEEL